MGGVSGLVLPLALVLVPGATAGQSEVVELPAGFAPSAAVVEDGGDGILALVARDRSSSLTFVRLSDPMGDRLAVAGMQDYYNVWHLADNRFLLRGIGDPPRRPDATEMGYSEVALVTVGGREARIVTERPISDYVDYETVARPSRDGKYWITGERFVWAEGRPRPINLEREGAGMQFELHSLVTGELERTLYVEFPGLPLREVVLFEVLDSGGPILTMTAGGFVHLLRFGDNGLSSEYLGLPPAGVGCARPLGRLDFGVVGRWQPAESTYWAWTGSSHYREERAWFAYELWNGGLSALSPAFPLWGMGDDTAKQKEVGSELRIADNPTYLYPHPDRGLVAVWVEGGRYRIGHSWRDLRVGGAVEMHMSDWISGKLVVSADQGPDVWTSGNGRYALAQEWNWTWDDEEERPEWVAERRGNGESMFLVRRMELRQMYARTDPYGRPVEIREKTPGEQVEPETDGEHIGGGVGPTPVQGAGRRAPTGAGVRPALVPQTGGVSAARAGPFNPTLDCAVVRPRLVYVEN